MLHLDLSKHSICLSAECGQCPYALGNDTGHLKDTWWQYWNVSSDLKAIQDQEAILHDIMTQINGTMLSVGGPDNHLVSVLYSLQMMSLLGTQFSTRLNLTQAQVKATEVYIIKLRSELPFFYKKLQLFYNLHNCFTNFTQTLCVL